MFSIQDLMKATVERMMSKARQSQAAQNGSNPADAASDPSEGGLFVAVQALGLKLEPRKLPLPLLVVEHLEKTPTEN
jgi:uncharacterized protein (TIGR03435 family)